MLYRKSRRLMVGVLAMLMVVGMVLPAMGQDVAVKIDGNSINLSSAPVIKDGVTLVPVRGIVEALGGEVSYDAASKTVKIKTTDRTISFPVGAREAKNNNMTEAMEAPAQIVNGSIMVPVKFLAEAVGAKLDYNEVGKIINIAYFSNLKGTLKIGGSTTIQPLSQLAADTLMKMNPDLSITIAGGGSGEGIKGAYSGTFNIGSVSRDLEEKDKKSYPGLTSYRIGTDGIVVIVNPKNMVGELTQQQVFDIFTGQVRNWKQVGGKDAAIFLQTRETGSGTLTAFEELALQKIDKKAKVAKTATPSTSNGLIKEAIAQNANAVGFLSMGYVDSSVKAVKVDGVSPLKSKALSREWPYVRTLNVVTKGQATGLTAKFIDYLLSPEGQSIVSQDYLPLKAVD